MTRKHHFDDLSEMTTEYMHSVLHNGKTRFLGPREARRRQEYLKLAQQEIEQEAKQKEEDHRNEISAVRFETAAREAQMNLDYESFVKSCLDEGYHQLDLPTMDKNNEIKRNVYLEPAVTLWSYKIQNGEKPDFPLTAIENPHRPFDRSAAFTNDIHDGRLKHSFATDNFVDVPNSPR